MATDESGDLAAQVGGLRASVDGLATATLAGEEAMRANERATLQALRRRTRLEVLLVLGLAAVGLALWRMNDGVHAAQHTAARSNAVASSTRDAIAAVRSTQIDTRETLRTIKDCTDTTGKCARRGQQGTAVAVASLKVGDLIAVWCVAQHPHDLAAAAACTRRTTVP